MTSPGFWTTVWIEDIRSPLRQVIRQLFFVACTLLGQVGNRALKYSDMEPWLLTVINNGCNGLTLVAFCVFFIVVLVGTISSGWRIVRRP